MDARCATIRASVAASARSAGDFASRTTLELEAEEEEAEAVAAAVAVAAAAFSSSETILASSAGDAAAANAVVVAEGARRPLPPAPLKSAASARNRRGLSGPPGRVTTHPVVRTLPGDLPPWRSTVQRWAG